MALNEFQKEEARRLFAEGKTTMDVYRHLGAKSAGFKSPIEYSTPSSILSAPTLGQQNRSQVVQTIADMPQDIFSGVKGLGEGYLDRFQRLQDTAGAALRGEQSFGETATQLSANIAGGAIADPAFALLKTGGSLLTTPEQERKIGEGFNQAVTAVGEKTGITDWYMSQSPRTQRNIDAALDIVDVAPVGITGKVKSLFKPRVAPEAKLAEVMAKAEQGDVTDGVRVATAALDDTVRQTEVDNLAKAYQDSLVGDRVKVNRLLQEQAADMSRGGVVLTQDDLIRSLANEGIIPDIRGKLADFTTEIRNLDTRQNELFNAYQPVLESSKATASIDDFASFTSRSMAESPNLRFELDKAENQLNTILQNLRRSYGLDENGTLTAKQIDDISRQANARTKAYRETDTFQADVYSELGRAARKWLNENIPDESFRKVNDEWLRLEQVKRTAEAMQNQQVDVGILGRALGSYVTTLSGVTLGASVANPAVAVAAGILTKLGGDAYADALRSTRFSPEIRAKLQERLTNDKALIEKLKKTATTQENKNLFDQASRMLPAPREGALRSEVTGGAPMRVAPQGETTNLPGDTLETARPGAVNVPEGEGRPLSRSLYPEISEQDLQKLKTDSFRKILADNGVDADTLAKAIAGGTVGTLLFMYIDEDGTMLPAFGAALGVAASGAGKARMIREAMTANTMRREALLRAGKSETSREIKILDKQMESLGKELRKISDTVGDTSDVVNTPNLADDIAKAKAEGKTFDEWVEKYIDDNQPETEVVGGMSHRPTKTAATADNISQDISPMGLPDFYERPNLYDYGSKEYKESIAALVKVKGKPDAEITIYRAAPKNELRVGDWVTLSKEKARLESLSEDVPVQTFKVKAKDIEFAGDDITEFGYWGSDNKAGSQLKAEWDKVQ